MAFENLKFRGIYKENYDLKEGLTKNDEKWSSVDILLDNNCSENRQQLVCSLFGAGQYQYKVENFIDYNQIGDDIEVELRFTVNFSKDGRPFNKLNIWKMTNYSLKDRNQQKIKQTAVAEKMPDAQMEAAVEKEADDDLPF